MDATEKDQKMTAKPLPDAGERTYRQEDFREHFFQGPSQIGVRIIQVEG